MPLCGRKTWSGQAEAAAMGEIVNLRQARKRHQRAARDGEATENRVIHGRSAAEKIAKKRADTLKEKRLEGHRRDPHETP